MVKVSTFETAFRPRVVNTTKAVTDWIRQSLTALKNILKFFSKYLVDSKTCHIFAIRFDNKRSAAKANCSCVIKVMKRKKFFDRLNNIQPKQG